MILSKDEAICLVLGFSAGNEVSSPTKLNKLLARLNLYLIPIDIDFSLNRYGSFCADLNALESTEYYELIPYKIGTSQHTRFKLTQKGSELFKKILATKLRRGYSEKEISDLKKTIKELSKLKASEISENEHEELLVDTEDRHKLIQRANFALADLTDLYSQLEEIKSDTLADDKLKGLIEYCYYLAKYLKNKFEKLGERYDYDAHMFDYYFLYHLTKVIKFLKIQISSKIKDEVTINKYYDYLASSVKGRYPFSLDNENLFNLIA